MGRKLFLDSVALISGALSSNDASPMRKIVALGEAKVLDLRISKEVERDAEYIVKARAPTAMTILAELIVKARIATTSDPNQDTIDRCVAMTGYLPDARILAAALECSADVLVTYDNTHLLNNAAIKPPEADILVMNPQEAIDWCFEDWKKERDELKESQRSRPAPQRPRR